MKRFFKIVGITTILLYGLNLGLDYIVSYKLQQSPDRRYRGWSNVINVQWNADLVIMGNSRAWVQYDPAILDSILHINSFNMGIDGSGFNRQILRYEVYNRYQAKKPRWIVMNIDYFSASDWTIGYEREQFFPYMWNFAARKDIEKVEPMTWVERYLPVCRYVTYKGLYNVLQEQPVDAQTYKGYMGHDLTWNAQAYNGLESYSVKFEKRTMEAFEQFLEERKRDGIKIIFCYAPIYIGFTNKVENLDEFFACYKSYAERYDIPILDYTYQELCMDTAYFYNASHLNRVGAEIFSTQLAHDLDSLNLIER